MCYSEQECGCMIHLNTRDEKKNTIAQFCPEHGLGKAIEELAYALDNWDDPSAYGSVDDAKSILSQLITHPTGQHQTTKPSHGDKLDGE